MSAIPAHDVKAGDLVYPCVNGVFARYSHLAYEPSRVVAVNEDNSLLVEYAMFNGQCRSWVRWKTARRWARRAAMYL